MGRRTILPKFQVLTDSDSTTNPESSPTDISSVDSISYQFELDATVDADLEVQFCNDSRITTDSVFVPLDFNQTTPLDGSLYTEGLVHIENKGFKWMKIAVINNGGTGNINSWVSGTVGGA